MSGDESGEDRPQRKTQFARWLDRLGDHFVDVAAVAALAGLAFSGAGGATVQILAGSIATVALGKKYYAGRKK